MCDMLKYREELHDLAMRLNTWPSDCFAIFRNRNGTVAKLQSKDEELPRIYLTHEQWIQLRRKA